MLGPTFNHDHLRAYTVVFGSLFNDIYINRDDAAGDVKQKIKVPIGYGPTEKVLARVKEQPHLEAPVAFHLPRITFEMGPVTYDPTRKLNSLSKITCTGPAGSYVRNPVPYNIDMGLWVITNKITDGNRIVEQILPYFTPYFSVPTKVLEALDIKHQVIIQLNSAVPQDNYEGSFEEVRHIIWEFNFTIKGYLYGPIIGVDGENTGLIKRVEARMLDGLEGSNVLETIVVTGGQTANGEATTTRPPSVPWEDVDPDLDWDFITEIE